MNELLDNPNVSPSKPLLNASAIFRLGLGTIILISYLFFRPLEGSDFDAILVLVGLWLCSAWFMIQHAIKPYSVILVFSTVIVRYFLVYIHHMVAWLVADLMPSQWRWSHFELIKGTPDGFNYIITEIIIWSMVFCFMVITATFIAILLERLRNRHNQ